MDSRGNIHPIETPEEKDRLEKLLGPLVELTDEQKALLEGQPTAERVSFYEREMAKRAAFNKHETDAERNKAKAERKERGK